MKRYERKFGYWQDVATGKRVDNRLLEMELDFRHQTEYYLKTIKVGTKPDYVTICQTEYRGNLIAVDENHVTLQPIRDDEDLSEQRLDFKHDIYSERAKEPLKPSWLRGLRWLQIQAQNWLSERMRFKPAWEKVAYRLTATERKQIKSSAQAFAADLKVMYLDDLIPYRGAVILFVDSDRCDFEYVSVLGLYDDPYEAYKAVIYSPEYRHRHPSSAKSNSPLFLNFDGYRHMNPAQIDEQIRGAIAYYCKQQAAQS